MTAARNSTFTGVFYHNFTSMVRKRGERGGAGCGRWRGARHPTHTARWIRAAGFCRDTYCALSMGLLFIHMLLFLSSPQVGAGVLSLA